MNELGTLKEALSNNSHVKRFPIEVILEQDKIKISGTVQTYFQKQLIITIACKHCANIPFSVENIVVM